MANKINNCKPKNNNEHIIRYNKKKNMKQFHFTKMFEYDLKNNKTTDQM